MNRWLGSCAVHLRTAAWTSTGNAIATFLFAWPRRGPPARLAAHNLQRRTGPRLAFAAMSGTEGRRYLGLELLTIARLALVPDEDGWPSRGWI